MPVSAEGDASDLGRASWCKNTMGEKTQVKLGSQGPGRDQYCTLIITQFNWNLLTPQSSVPRESGIPST